MPRAPVSRLLLLTFLLLLLMPGCEGPEPKPGETIEVRRAVAPASFDARRALGHAAVLAEGIGARPAGSAGEIRATDYISWRLESYGYDVELEPFALPQGGLGWNVVATPPGFSWHGQWLLVGAHHDSVGGPGANDNASGVGALLELARALSVRPSPLPTVVVAFGAEEVQPTEEKLNLVGSRAFVASLGGERRGGLTRVLIFDAIGRGDDLILVRVLSTPGQAVDEVAALAQSLGIPARAEYTASPSDDRSFLEADIPAAWIWSGLFPGYHGPEDGFQYLEEESIERAGRVGLGYLRRIQDSRFKIED